MILSGPREGSILSWSKSTDLEHLESLKALKRCPQCLTWTGRPVDRSIWVPPFSKMQGFAPQQMHESLLVSMWIFLASWSDVSNTGIKCPTIQRSKNHHFHHIILGLFHGSISHKKNLFTGGNFRAIMVEQKQRILVGIQRRITRRPVTHRSHGSPFRPKN